MSECLFCKIASGDTKADVVRETETTVAFRDINPMAPTHVLVIPRAHHATMGDLATADPEITAAVLRECVAVAEQEGIAESGYRTVFNTGPNAGQAVFHVHAHVIGGRGLGWPPG